MTMPRGASRALYAGNGQATEFPFFFKVFEEDQLSVHITSPAGVTSEAAGWTAELDESGGTVSYLHNGAPLPEGWKLAIVRDMPFVQEVDLITGTRFDPEVIETALDVATAERQQLLERLGRAIVVEPTDEAGPEVLLADIRDARASSAASEASARASANAAAASAQAAAGSAAIATEEREAACICAQESRAARDAAIAQAEAANTLMEAEIAKVNAIVAANKTDQQAAVTAARQWAEKAPDMPVEYDEAGNAHYSAQHWAARAQKLANNPDGETITVDADGVLKALGGNLLMNDEIWIAESGDFTVPCTGWYAVTCINGGDSGGVSYDAAIWAAGGNSGAFETRLMYLQQDEIVNVSIGAGGVWAGLGAGKGARGGGTTTFKDFTPNTNRRSPGQVTLTSWTWSAIYAITAVGGGFGAKGSNMLNANYYGGGGSAYQQRNSAGTGPDSTQTKAGNGYQGAVRLRFWNPAKANGPALFAARRMARTAAAPTVVNLYDPETGQGSVWRAEDAEAKLAGGLVSETAWLAICTEQAAEERAAWLADPATEAERFAMLRAAREARLAATDYLVAPDYPLTAAQRAAVTAYRQALRDLPADAGAPWDGGGDGTPWPAMPEPEAASEAPCA